MFSGFRQLLNTLVETKPESIQKERSTSQQTQQTNQNQLQTNQNQLQNQSLDNQKYQNNAQIISSPDKSLSELPGLELVQHYEDKWLEIHDNSVAIVENMNKIESTLLSRCRNLCTKQEEQIKQLHNNIACLPDIHRDIINSTNQIQSIMTSVMELDAMLTMILNQKTEEKFDKLEKKANLALLEYESKKRQELSNLVASSASVKSQKKQTTTPSSRLEDVMLETVEDDSLNAFYSAEEEQKKNDNNNTNTDTNTNQQQEVNTSKEQQNSQFEESDEDEDEDEDDTSLTIVNPKEEKESENLPTLYDALKFP